MSSYYSAQEQARNDQVDVIATSTTISQAPFKDQERNGFVLRNTSPNAVDIITIKLGNEKAIANEGIVLRQYDIYSESIVNSKDDIWQGAIQGICATANGKLSIMER